MSVPVYTTAEQVIARVARILGMTPAQLVQDGPQWAGIGATSAHTANIWVHRQLVAKIRTSAEIQSDPGVGEWAGRVGLCFALREAKLSGTFNTDVLKDVCECLEEGEQWIPLTADGELGQSLTASWGLRNTSGDRFSLDMES